MKKSFFQNNQMIGLLCGAAALAVAALAPQSANAANPPAGSAANAKILNVVTVTYFDASGANQHQAATSTSVTVALKEAALTVTNQVPFSNVDSGSSTTSYVALTANANGSDSYKITFGDTASLLSSHTATTNIVTSTSGANPTGISTGQTVTLGATSIVSFGAAGTTQTINIPAGSRNGIQAGSVVVINGTSFKVTAVTDGTQAGYTNTGSSTALGTKTDEVYGTITIAADTDTNGSAASPDLASLLAGPGTIIGERKYLQITDTAKVSSNGTDGTDVFTISTDTATPGHVAALSPDSTATFYHVQVAINKTVSSSTGKPGDVLEYQITVSNSTQGTANLVTVTDAVPDYTTLVSGASYGAGGGSGAAGEIFATINDGTNTVNATLNSPGSQTQPTGYILGYGGTNGGATTARTAITFYLGTGATSSTGGNIVPNKTYTIKYQVKIN